MTSCIVSSFYKMGKCSPKLGAIKVLKVPRMQDVTDKLMLSACCVVMPFSECHAA